MIDGNELLQNDLTAASDKKIFAIKVDERVIDILIANYSDRVLVVLTQSGTLGTILKVRRSEATQGEVPEVIFEVSTLFGEDRVEYHVLARALAESMQTDRPLVFGIALKGEILSLLPALKTALLENKVW